MKQACNKNLEAIQAPANESWRLLHDDAWLRQGERETLGPGPMTRAFLALRVFEHAQEHRRQMSTPSPLFRSVLVLGVQEEVRSVKRGCR